MEPFVDSSNVMNFKNQLSMDNAIANSNGKIWLFWNGDVECVVKDHDEQQITCDLSHNELQDKFTIIFVYEKCKENIRRPLCYLMLQQEQI